MEAQRQPVQNLETSLTSGESTVKPVLARPTYSSEVYTPSDISDILKLAHSMQEKLVVDKAVSDLSDKLKERGLATPAECYDPNKISQESLYATASDLGIEPDYVKRATEKLKPSLQRIQADVSRFNSIMPPEMKFKYLVQDYVDALRKTADANSLDDFSFTAKASYNSYTTRIAIYKKNNDLETNLLNNLLRYFKPMKKIAELDVFDLEMNNSNELYPPKLKVFSPVALSVFGDDMETVSKHHSVKLQVKHMYRTDK